MQLTTSGGIAEKRRGEERREETSRCVSFSSLSKGNMLLKVAHIKPSPDVTWKWMKPSNFRPTFVSSRLGLDACYSAVSSGDLSDDASFIR